MPLVNTGNGQIPYYAPGSVSYIVSLPAVFHSADPTPETPATDIPLTRTDS